MTVSFSDDSFSPVAFHCVFVKLFAHDYSKFSLIVRCGCVAEYDIFAGNTLGVFAHVAKFMSLYEPVRFWKTQV